MKSTGLLVASLIGSTVITNIVTADQYIAIVLPGRMFKGAFDSRGLAPVVLSRAIGDSATVTSALIPWNSCGAFMAATLGVAVFELCPLHLLQPPEPAGLDNLCLRGIPHVEKVAAQAGADGGDSRRPVYAARKGN